MFLHSCSNHYYDISFTLDYGGNGLVDMSGDDKENGEVIRVVESNSIEILGQKLSYPTTLYGAVSVLFVGLT